MEMHIRGFEESDLLPLFELLSDEEVMRYIEPPYTLEQTEAFLKKAGLSDPPLIYAAEDEEGNFAGYVIWHDYEEGCKEIGWILKRAYWGKGCAQALTKQLIARTASEGKSAVIECDPEQQVTRHIAEKFGFIYVGCCDGCDVYRLEDTGADKHGNRKGRYTDPERRGGGL